MSASGGRFTRSEPAALSLPNFAEIREIVRPLRAQHYRDVVTSYRGGSGMGYGEALWHLGIDVGTGKAIVRSIIGAARDGEPVKRSQVTRFTDRLRELRGGSDE